MDKNARGRWPDHEPLFFTIPVSLFSASVTVETGYKELRHLLQVAIKSANSTFSCVRWRDVACTLFDTWPHMLRGVLSKLLTFCISSLQNTISQLVKLNLPYSVLVLYNLIIRILCFNAHATCIHSNTCGRFDMIEPLDKTLPDFKSPARDVLSSNTAEHTICRRVIHTWSTDFFQFSIITLAKELRCSGNTDCSGSISMAFRRLGHMCCHISPTYWSPRILAQSIKYGKLSDAAIRMSWK